MDGFSTDVCREKRERERERESQRESPASDWFGFPQSTHVIRKNLSAWVLQFSLDSLQLGLTSEAHNWERTEEPE